MSSHTALVAQDNVEGKYNIVYQYNIGTAATIEVRAFCNNGNNNNNNNKSSLIKY